MTHASNHSEPHLCWTRKRLCAIICAARDVHSCTLRPGSPCDTVGKSAPAECAHTYVWLPRSYMNTHPRHPLRVRTLRENIAARTTARRHGKYVDPGERLVGPGCLLLQSPGHAIFVHCSRRGVAVMAGYYIVYCSPPTLVCRAWAPLLCDVLTSGTLAVSVASVKH